MSAVFGFYNRKSAAANESVLRQMADAMPHRGSDGCGFWSNGDVGLGQRLGWTTPESLHERLPLSDKSGRFTLTAAARIDNRAELIAQLEIDRPSTAVITDCDLILASYIAWGENCVDHLLGDFAFAVWDSTAATLFLARDHFGVQPLVYASSKDAFLFASDAGALRCLDSSAPGFGEPNEHEIAAFLGQCELDPSSTFFREIFRLPAAHCMVVSSSGERLRNYWQLDAKKEISLASDDEYAARFLEIFSEAIRCRMRSVGDVGCMLSGGIDSSSITCTASKRTGRDEMTPLRTYSAVVSGTGPGQERGYIDTVLDSGNYLPTFFATDETSPLDSLTGMVTAIEEPDVPGNLYTNWNIYRLAAQDGVKVVLEGFDGDNAVGHGTGYLRELAISGKWVQLAVELHAYTANLTHESFPGALWAWYRQYGHAQAIGNSRAGRFIRKALRRKPGRPVDRASLSAGQDVKQRLNQRMHRLLEDRRVSPKTFNFKTEREMHRATLVDFNPAAVLEMLGRVGAVHGIEVRFPFMDVRLVEFCLALPPTQKMRNGVTRIVIRNAMRGVLPEPIRVRRTKGEYDRVFVTALKLKGGTRLSELYNSLSKVDGFVDRTRIELLEKRFFTEELPNEEVLELWHTLCLSEWIRMLGCKPEAKVATMAV